MGDLARAVFLDRDGTLNVEKHYLSKPEELELFEGVPESLRRLQSVGMELFVVTNQSGIGRGYFSEEDMHRVHERLCSMLRPYGVTFQHIYYAPEVPGQPSYGRKPSPQFIWDAARDYRLDLKQSFMIGNADGQPGLRLRFWCARVMGRIWNRQAWNPKALFIESMTSLRLPIGYCRGRKVNRLHRNLSSCRLSGRSGPAF
jgi:D-glycero-D-manno-heptose 1,7-bisphosphate phosphatase